MAGEQWPETPVANDISFWPQDQLRTNILTERNVTKDSQYSKYLSNIENSWIISWFEVTTTSIGTWEAWTHVTSTSWKKFYIHIKNFKEISVTWDYWYVYLYLPQNKIDAFLNNDERWIAIAEIAEWQSFPETNAIPLAIINWSIVVDSRTMISAKNTVDSSSQSIDDVINTVNYLNQEMQPYWDWSDWTCIIESWNHYLTAKTYNFDNLYICSWATIHFCWDWVPVIKVKNCFCNMWTISTYWPWVTDRAVTYRIGWVTHNVKNTLNAFTAFDPWWPFTFSWGNWWAYSYAGWAWGGAWCSWCKWWWPTADYYWDGWAWAECAWWGWGWAWSCWYLCNSWWCCSKWWAWWNASPCVGWNWWNWAWWQACSASHWSWWGWWYWYLCWGNGWNWWSYWWQSSWWAWGDWWDWYLCCWGNWWNWATPRCWSAWKWGNWWNSYCWVGWNWGTGWPWGNWGNSVYWNWWAWGNWASYSSWWVYWSWGKGWDSVYWTWWRWWNWNANNGWNGWNSYYGTWWEWGTGWAAGNWYNTTLWCPWGKWGCSMFWNWGNAGDTGNWYANCYSPTAGNTWWCSAYWTWGKWWKPWVWWYAIAAAWQGWHWRNWWIWWDTKASMCWCCTATWGTGWDAWGWQYALFIITCKGFNTCIDASWWTWGRWWNAPIACWTWGNWGRWWVWWEVLILYWDCFTTWSINVSWWAWWAWGSGCKAAWAAWATWANWCCSIAQMII